MKLIVGLGNPGGKHARNRHNVGFVAAERIGERNKAASWRSRFRGEASEVELAGERCLLLKPSTYMNLSGEAVGEAQRFLKIEPADVIVLHDELDLAPGKLKVKTGGGNAGHNGLRSISQHIGNEYVRLRIGIGHPGHKDLVHGYVLHDFAKSDAAWLEPLLDAIADEFGHLVLGDQGRFMTEVCRRVDPKPPKQPKEVKGKALGGDSGGADQAGAGKDDDKDKSKSAGASGFARELMPSGPLADKLKDWLSRGRG